MNPRGSRRFHYMGDCKIEDRNRETDRAVSRAYRYLCGIGGIVLVAGAVHFLGMFLLIPLPTRLTRPAYATVIRYRDGTWMRVYLSNDEKWRIATRLSDLDPLLIRTTICYEDRWFTWHPGVNPLAIARAALQNIRARRVVSGGSTLAMQLARLLEPRPRTLTAKVVESWRALQYTMRLGRRGVLRAYLQYAPYGGNIDGVMAAAWAYFGHPPRRLSPAEVAFLVSLPQAPRTRFLLHADPARVRRARDHVLERMAACRLIDARTLHRARSMNIPRRLHPMPLEAPHAADELYLRYRGRPWIRSSIDRRVQRIAERVVQAHRMAVLQAGATQVSVVVVDNATRKVRALVGAMDYWDREHHGQVRGFRALRSPGSALKPFLYALALERGVITPASLLEDFPIRIGDYRPANFKGAYYGLIPAEDALALSLNIPFVLLLRRTGFRTFMHHLASAGIHIQPHVTYGLSVIAGALEVRLLDLTNLYVTLARHGWHGPLRFREDASPIHEFRWLHPGAVALTVRALQRRHRPDAAFLSDVVWPRATVAWKTGTSWGRRDAWSVGFHRAYTVGVWVGNFTGEGRSGIVGAAVAAPIMFDILWALDPGQDTPPHALPGVISVEVCAFSGYRATPACPRRKTVQAVRGTGILRSCPYHQRWRVYRTTGRRLCPWRGYRSETVELRTFTIIPPLARPYLTIPVDAPPLPPADCGIVTASAERLRILQPQAGGIYDLTRAIIPQGGVPLMAETPASDDRIAWFVNGRFMGTTRSGEVQMVDPPEGPVTVVAVDRLGHTARVRIRVIRPDSGSQVQLQHRLPSGGLP